MYTLQGLPALAYMHVTVYITCTHLPCTQFKVSQHLPICMSTCTYHVTLAMYTLEGLTAQPVCMSLCTHHVHTYQLHTSRSPALANMHVTLYRPCTHLPCTHLKVSQHNQYACQRVHTDFSPVPVIRRVV